VAAEAGETLTVRSATAQSDAERIIGLIVYILMGNPYWLEAGVEAKRSSAISGVGLFRRAQARTARQLSIHVARDQFRN
jgi:hypothetical protein